MLLFFLFLFVAPAGGERDIVITTSVWCLCVWKYVRVCVSVWILYTPLLLYESFKIGECCGPRIKRPGFITVYVFFLSNLWILILFIYHLTYLFSGQKWLKIVKCPSVPTEILLRAHLFLHEWDNEKNRGKKTNFIVCLNDNEVKWYSDDTVT